jgi:hypothetical protein
MTSPFLLFALWRILYSALSLVLQYPVSFLKGGLSSQCFSNLHIQIFTLRKPHNLGTIDFGIHRLRRVSYLSPYKKPAPTAVVLGGPAERHIIILSDFLALKKVNKY